MGACDLEVLRGGRSRFGGLLKGGNGLCARNKRWSGDGDGNGDGRREARGERREGAYLRLHHWIVFWLGKRFTCVWVYVYLMHGALKIKQRCQRHQQSEQGCIYVQKNSRHDQGNQ